MMIHQFLHHRKHIECVLWWNHIVCGHLKQRIIPQIRAWFPTISCTEPHEWEISICIQMWFSHITANVMALTIFIWCNISVQIGGGILINRTQFRCSVPINPGMQMVMIYQSHCRYICIAGVSVLSCPRSIVVDRDTHTADISAWIPRWTVIRMWFVSMTTSQTFCATFWYRPWSITATSSAYGLISNIICVICGEQNPRYPFVR